MPTNDKGLEPETDAPDLTSENDETGLEPQTKPPVDSKPKTIAELQAALAAAEQERDIAVSNKVKANDDAAKDRIRMTKAEKAVKEREDADKTELQRAQDDLAAAQKEAADAKAVAKRHTVLNELRNAGKRLSLQLNDDAVTTLYDAGYFNSLEPDADGKYPQMDSAVKDLIKAKSFVLDNTVVVPDIHAVNKGKAANFFENVRAETKAKYGADAPAKRDLNAAGIH